VTTHQVQEAERWSILTRLDRMSKRSIGRLAEILHVEDTTQDVETHRRAINRAVKERKDKMKAGIWRGPKLPGAEG
jgi:hypothetical protein